MGLNHSHSIVPIAYNPLKLQLNTSQHRANSDRRPSKSYTFDSKGEIAEKNILRFRQLSGPIVDFLHLLAFDEAALADIESTATPSTCAFSRCEIPLW